MTRALALAIAAELLVGGWLVWRHVHALHPPVPDPSAVDAVTAAEFRDLAAAATTADGWGNLGEAYLATGFYPEAAACLTRAAALDPTADRHFKHAFALERLGLLEDANAEYRAAAAANHPRAKDCWYYVGRNHLRLENAAAAAEAFAKAQPLPGARFELARLAGQADAEAGRLATEFPTAYPPVALRLRLAVLRNENTTALADAFARRPRPLPTPFDAEVDWVMGRASGVGHARLFRDAGRDLQAGRAAAAEEKLRAALAARWDPEVADKLADVRFAQGDRAEALRILTEVVDRGGPTAQSLWRRGQAEEAGGQLQQAVATWERAAALASGPGGRDLLQDLAAAHERLGDKEKAKRYPARAHLAAGIAAVDAGRWDEATTALGHATEADPASANAWFELAEAHRLAGRPADARAAYERCLKLNPDHGRAARAVRLLPQPRGVIILDTPAREMVMATATAEKFMTVDEFLALPEDKSKRRMLIRGKLWEREIMTKRNRVHSRLMVRVSYLLEGWLEKQPDPRGEVACGEVGAILNRERGTTVGIDVAYFGPDVTTNEDTGTTLYDGPPELAVEILSPSNTQDEVMNKVEDYLACNVPLTWVIEPRHRTVTVYRPDAEPVLFNVTQTLAGDAAPPGFSCPVADLFR